MGATVAAARALHRPNFNIQACTAHLRSLLAACLLLLPGADSKLPSCPNCAWETTRRLGDILQQLCERTRPAADPT